jgi:hypothetical protein
MGKRDDFYEGVIEVKGVKGVKAYSFDYENIYKSMG